MTAQVDSTPSNEHAPATISLLHATFFRPGGPLPVRDRWLETASRPEFVEYIAALDSSDQRAIDATAKTKRIISPSVDEVTAVRNWNAAASIAKGALLFVIADDLVPPAAWDNIVRESIGALDPDHVSFAVKVLDSERPGIKMLHPVVSRRFFEELGLFDPDFTGVYCDDDITTRAFWRSAILDGTKLVLLHVNPTDSPIAQPTISHKRVNASEEFERGAQLYRSKWSVARRVPLKRHGRLIAVQPGDTSIRRNRVIAARLLTVYDFARWTVRRSVDYLLDPRSLRARIRSG